MKKYVVLLVLILLMSLILAACGSSQNASQGANVSPASKIQPTVNNDQEKAKVVDNLKLTIGTGSAGGFWATIGEGIGSIVRTSLPKSQFSVETGLGVSNIMKVETGELPLGIAFVFEMSAAQKGEEPFKKKYENLVGLSTVFNYSPVHFVMSKSFANKYGIQTMEDIATKKPPIRIAVNQNGNLLEKINRLVLESYGITYDKIKQWGGQVYYVPYKEASDMMKDNKVDWYGATLFVPDAKVQELGLTKEIKLMSINEKAQDYLTKQMGLPKAVIPANSYKGQSEDVNTLDSGAKLLIDPKLPNDVAYTVTKTIVDNLHKYKAMSKSLASLTPEIMADVAPAKLHPGAAQYYKEIGVLK